MELDFNKIPYISVLSLIILKYQNFNEIKDEICNSNTIPVKMGLILFTILIFSAIIEYNLGHYFILLLILMVNIIQYGDFNNDYMKNIVNDKMGISRIDDKLFMYVMFLFGSFIVTSCYMSKTHVVCGLFIIFGLCILFAINYLVLVTSDPSKKSTFKKMIKNMILGVITPALVLSWCEYERKPLVKYVKLFYRK